MPARLVLQQIFYTSLTIRGGPDPGLPLTRCPRLPPDSLPLLLGITLGALVTVITVAIIACCLCRVFRKRGGVKPGEGNSKSTIPLPLCGLTMARYAEVDTAASKWSQRALSLLFISSFICFPIPCSSYLHG